MIILAALWFLMAAAAVNCGLRLTFLPAVMAWAGLAGTACAVGAWLIAHQPMGVATTGGRIGSAAVHWGFRVGRGQLLPATGISWAIWFFLGTALIGLTQFPQHLPIIACWIGDSFGLIYVAGMMLGRQSGGAIPASLYKISLILVGLIAVSTFLWFQVGTDGARAIAAALAGGPPFFIGIGYGFIFAIGLLTNRRNKN